MHPSIHRLRSAGRAFALLLCAVPALVSAQTTGTISGRALDETGAVLPGVRVEVKSDALQGGRTAVTEGDGTFRLPLLPPGSYQVKFALDGFADEARTVNVGLGRSVDLDVTMKAATAEEITVSADVPVVDVTTTALGTNLDALTMETLPTGRNYASVVQVAPGVGSDANPENKGQTTITVYGSSGAENGYYIDGVNTTGVEYGFQGKELAYEFVQAVDVKTGGYEAEFGRATGGIVNVVTKSGGNEFRGDVFGYWDSDSLQSSADPVVSTGGTVEGYTKKDFGADLGGYLMKDRLWFFVAYDKVKNSNDVSLPAGPQAGEIVTSDSDRDLGAAKLTWNATGSQSVIGSFFQDPRQDTGAITDGEHSLNGQPSTYLGRQDLGGRDYALRYEGLFGGDWVATAQVARHEEENSIGPATAAGAGVEYRFVDQDFFQTGGFGLIQDKNFQRDFYGASLAKYLGGHELKGGVEYEDQTADVVKRMSGGQRVDVYGNPLDPSRPIYRHFYWTTPDATLENAPLGALVSTPEHQNTTVYLQDRWSVAHNLTFNLGVRWDRQQIIDTSGKKQIDLEDDYAPRLGFVWDPTNDGRSKVFGSYGHYYEQIPMDLVIRSFSYERQPRTFNFDPVATAPDPEAEAILDVESAILGGSTEPSDPNLKNQYVREIILGAEREVMPDVAVGVKGIYRDYGRVIEDFLCADDGTYCIGNPGSGIMREVFTYDYAETRRAPEAKREYRGIQLDATKRMSHGWQAAVSYIWSKLEGNFDGGYSPFTNVGADPNISAAYDYYDFFTAGRLNDPDLARVTNDGPLSNDRRHQFKASGTWQSDLGLSVGVSAYWKSGTPVTRYGFNDGYGRYEYFLTRRGAEGRTPAIYEADLHLGYPIHIGPADLNVLVDVFNLLDAQRAVLLDERWGFQEADNTSATPVNPGYKKPVLRTAPRSIRLGLRLSF